MKKPGLTMAAIGVFIMFLWFVFVETTILDASLIFAFLILVPLLLEEIIQSPENNRAEQWIWNVMLAYLPFSVAGMLAVALPPGLKSGSWALLWFFFTLLIAFGGLMRWLGRGWFPIHETIIDIGLIYIAAGGVWFVLASVGVETIAGQIQALHFHYAGFVLLVLIGLFGRWLSAYKKTGTGRPYQVLGVGVALGPLFILNVSHQHFLGFVVTAVYVLFLVWLCLWWLWCSVEFKMWPKMALRIASLLLILTMGLSIMYRLGLEMNTYWLGVGDMTKWHGTFNALFFSWLAVAAWRSIHPVKGYTYTNFPVSRLRIRGSSDHVSEWRARHLYAEGLVHDLSSHQSVHFDPGSVHTEVRRFLEKTTDYKMGMTVRWRRGFNLIAVLFQRLRQRAGVNRIDLSSYLEVEGEVVPVREGKDGRKNVKAWVRKNIDTNETMLTNYYSSHHHRGRTYINIAYPLPVGVITVVQILINDGDGGLILSSSSKEDRRGDEGVYLSFGNWTLRTILCADFHVRAEHPGRLQACYKVKVGKAALLKISYRIEKKENHLKLG
ncbi:YndJ family protein [Halobacillus sp. A1]|uniref:YndJ family protein n=1 Tax=Halobacillus sp. A1 TaxID=2880262 RepID=UPI0020A659BB|nr:YndJ family protein [Halobacillus sp. A1]MCP3031844.1 YndJ family protein [Halobacillus sp. A1]